MVMSLASNQNNALQYVAIAIGKVHQSVSSVFLKCINEKPLKCEINRQVDKVKLYLELFSLLKIL